MLVIVAALGGCAQFHERQLPSRDDANLRALTPQISIVTTASTQSAFVVDQDPIALTAKAISTSQTRDDKTGRTVTAITWSLPSTTPWRFSAIDGIKFAAVPTIDADSAAALRKSGLLNIDEINDAAPIVVRCEAVDTAALQYRCLLDLTKVPKGTYKYIINLTNPVTREVKRIDPNIMI